MIFQIARTNDRFQFKMISYCKDENFFIGLQADLRQGGVIEWDDYPIPAIRLLA